MFHLLIRPSLILSFLHLHRFQQFYIPLLSDELFYSFLSDSQELIRPSCILISNNAVIAFDQFFYHISQSHFYQNLNLWRLTVTLQVVNRIDLPDVLCIFL